MGVEFKQRKRFGRLLRTLRRSVVLTQQQLAERTGLWHGKSVS